jgi:hypothetical protein
MLLTNLFIYDLFRWDHIKPKGGISSEQWIESTSIWTEAVVAYYEALPIPV